MTQRTLLITLLALAALVPSSALAQTSYTLPNGLEVVLDPLPGHRSVAVVVSVEVGHRDQPEGWSGLAHMVEHLMFQGTRAAPGEFLSRIEALGGSQMNGVTSADTTSYTEVVPSEQLAHVLWLEADRFATLPAAIDERVIEEQRRVIARERTERELDEDVDPSIIHRLLYGEDHPYARSRERGADVDAIGVAEVQWFFQRFYAPDHLTLVLSGGFDPAVARAQIEATFGRLRRSGPPPAERERMRRPRMEQEHRLVVRSPRALDSLYVAWPTPAYGASGDAELDFVARELTHRLEERLVQSGLVQAVSARQASSHLVSDFGIRVLLDRRTDPPAVLAHIDSVLGELERSGVAAPVVDAWRSSWTEWVQRGMEDPIDRAWAFARRPPAFPDGRWTIEAELARYQAVEPDRLRRAVAALLPRDRRLVLAIVRDERAPEGGQVIPVDSTWQRVR